MTEERVRQLLESVQSASGSPRQDFVERLRADVIAEATSDSSIDQHGNELGATVMIDLDTHEPELDEDNRQKREKRWPAAIAVAAVALLVVGVVALLIDRGESESVTASLDNASALETSNNFFEVFNEGDAAGVLSLATEDVVSRDNFGNYDEPRFDRAGWEGAVEWLAAQGTFFRSPVCEVADNAGDAITVTCVTQTLDTAIQAAGALPVETVAALVVTADGISDVGFTYGATEVEDVGVPYSFINRRENFTRVDFDHASTPFEDWLVDAGISDSDGTGFMEWDSAESARAAGERRSELAAQWKEYLEANGCGAPESIPQPITIEDVAEDTARMRCTG